MNKIFSLKRFGKYFLYDLGCAKNNFLLTLLILAFLPEMCFAFGSLLGLVFGFSSQSFLLSMRYSALVGGLIAVALIFSSKVYGRITVKRYGSDWLLIPASTFEKWLSMVLVTCVVLPAVYFTLNLGGDMLMCTLFPKTYGEMIDLSSITDTVGVNSDSGIYLNLPLASWLGWCENILIFTLGALIFKKNKVGKTILAYFAVIMLISAMIALGFGSITFQFDGSSYQAAFEKMAGTDPQQIMSMLNAFINITYFVIFTLLLGGLYLRIRNIKH